MALPVNKRRDRVVIAGHVHHGTPYDGTRRPRYQLSVDLPGIADEPEFVFSTTMILDAEKSNSLRRRDPAETR